MNKWSRLAGVLFVSLLLVGGLFASMQRARADLARRPTLAISEPVTTLATTLTLDIPDMPFETETSKTLDLLNYTTYDGDQADLGFLADVSGGSYLEIGIAGDHYLSMTSTRTYRQAYQVTVEVSDTGGLTDTATFAVEVSNRPEIDLSYDPWGRLPLVTCTAGTSCDDVFYLNDFASDEDYGDIEGFSIVNSLAVSAGVSIDAGNYVDINPPGDFKGTIPVEVQVRDTAGLTDTDSFTLTVNIITYVYLPLVLRNHYNAPLLQPIDNPDGDGDYTLEWLYASNDPVSYDVEFSLNDPLFTSPELGSSGGTSVGSLFNWSGVTRAGTHYWRVRAYSYSTEEYTPWSNVQSTSVSQFAYLVADNESYAFNLTIEVWGNGISDSTIYIPRTYGYWRSLPVGTYTFRITNELCYPDTRTQKVSLANAGAGGAWYRIPMCDPITGPHPDPYP